MLQTFRWLLILSVGEQVDNIDPNVTIVLNLSILTDESQSQPREKLDTEIQRV